MSFYFGQAITSNNWITYVKITFVLKSAKTSLLSVGVQYFVGALAKKFNVCFKKKCSLGKIAHSSLSW